MQRRRFVGQTDLSSEQTNLSGLVCRRDPPSTTGRLRCWKERIEETFLSEDSAASSPDIDVISETLNSAASELNVWAVENGMDISAPKSTTTLFTPWSKQVNKQLDVSIDSVPVPTVKNPRMLGVTFDPTFSFSSHADNVARRAASRLHIMKALADSTFGKDKECLLMTFKMFIRSLFNYAAAIVYPNYSATSIRKLQLVQNRALRLALGCHSASSFDHIHNEAMELPVENHLRLLSAQFLARALQENHASHQHVTQDRGRRPMKETLRSKVLDDVSPYLDANGKTAPGDLNRVNKALHTDAVARAIDQLGSSRVLNTKPPPIDKSESSLPRLVRTTLSQLRSGFCARLKSFQFRIGREDNDTCPECGTHSHDSAHLFNCQSRPTALSTESLWSNPWGVATFLKTLPSFNFLPDIETPPPQGRRRRRPPPRPPPRPPQPLSPLPPPVFSPLDIASSFIFTPPGIRPLMSIRPRSQLSPVSSTPLFSSISSTSLSPSSPCNARSVRGNSEDLFESDVG